MHFGDGAQCNYHLFFNRKTGRAKVIMQRT